MDKKTPWYKSYGAFAVTLLVGICVALIVLYYVVELFLNAGQHPAAIVLYLVLITNLLQYFHWKLKHPSKNDH